MAEIAIGAASFGIQICDKLVWYIDGVKNAGERKTQISEQIDQLANILEVLENVIQDGQVGRSHSLTEAGIVACSDAIDKIRSKLGPIGHANPLGLRPRLKKITEKLWYPFKQGDILHCKEVLESIQRNLNTALAILTMERSRHQFEQTQAQLKSQNQLIHSGFQALLKAQQFQQNHVGILLQKQAYPEQRNEPVAAALERLETKIDGLTSHNTSAHVIEQSANKITRLSHRISKIHLNRRSRPVSKVPVCGCTAHSTTLSYAKWPIQIIHSSTKRHEPDCQYHVSDSAASELEVRLTLCSLFLKRKADLSLRFARGSGSVSILPALRTSRVVPWDSPAFVIIDSFMEQLESIRFARNATAPIWNAPKQELHKLFQTGAASPHDRLPDGSTLLHWLCSQHRYSDEFLDTMAEDQYQMAEFLFQFMEEEEVRELDEDGRSCLDLAQDLVVDCADTRLLTKLVDAGASISSREGEYNFLLRIFDLAPESRNIDTSLLECSDLLKSMLLKSEPLLEAALHNEAHYLEEGTGEASVYDLAVACEWGKGCEIMWRREIPVTRGPHGRPFLARGYDSPELLKSLLRIRSRCEDPNTLQTIGGLEDAFSSTYSNSKETKTRFRILAALVEQRRQLQHLAATYLPGKYSSAAGGGLVDLLARDAFDDLVDHGRPVSLSLRPESPVYYSTSPGLSVRTLDLLYDAGFRETGPFPTKSHYYTSISPLLFFLTIERSQYRSEETVLEIADWFLAKGASLQEQWPDTDLSVLHLLGWKFGYEIHGWNKQEERPHMTEKYFTNRTCTDPCRCHCSSAGCSFLTMAYKGLDVAVREHMTPEDSFWKPHWALFSKPFEWVFWIMEWIIPVAAEPENRWLVVEFIRLVTFTTLGIRHTCCNPGRILRAWNEDVDFNISLFDDGDNEEDEEEEFDDDDEEDDHELTDEEENGDEESDAHENDGEGGDTGDERPELLEKLISEFDEMFCAYEHCFEDFVYEILLSRLEEEVKRLKRKDARLKREDIARFEDGRRQLGVVMEIEDSDNVWGEWDSGDNGGGLGEE